MITAAIVGLGWWGQSLVNSVQGSQAIRFTLAHTRNPAPVAAYCADRGLTWVPDLDTILRDPTIQAVVFATPHSTHTDQVARAAAAGKHVFVEKPFALTLADAHASVAAADRAGIVLGVGFNRRFHPSMALLKRAVRERLGTVVTLSGEQTATHGLSLTPEAWRAQTSESPGGAMTAIGVHLIDGMIDLNGPIQEVFARVSRRAATAADDTTDILLRFANGASGHVFCSTAATPNYRMAAYGTGGFAEILGHPMATFRLVPSAGGATQAAHRATGAVEETETPGFNMLTAELEAFATAIATGQPFPTPLSEILHGVAVFEAILRSARSGRSEVVIG